MIFYISTPIYQQVIAKTIQETGCIIQGHEVSSEVYLLKYIKENLKRLEGVDHFVLDICAVQDMDKEIIEALETLRIMEASMKIILLATNYKEGDELLVKCFQMSIYDLIISDDFNVIREELKGCIMEGKQYKDALRYTKASRSGTEKATPRNEVRQAANKVMLGFAGAQNRIGTTHNAILLGNHLRKQGYMVAVVEYNASGCFELIKDEFGENVFDGSYFSMNGVDYYPNVDAEALNGVIGKAYNFIVIDFGCFLECDRTTFHKCHEYFVLMGSKPWEVETASEVFRLAGGAVGSYHYYFNFTRKEVRKDIKDGMEGLPSVHFLEYIDDPFGMKPFPDVEDLLKNYLPIKQGTEKKSIFDIKPNLFRKTEKNE